MRLNKVCEIEDWASRRRVVAMRDMLPYFVDMNPRYPEGMEHRKHWEYAQLMCGLEQLNVLSSEACVLSVGAGHEEPVFALTRRVRWVFATDVYGTGNFRLGEGDSRMLMSPEIFARFPFNRNRLVVQWMSGLDLRYEAASFDACFSMSSIEHFGGVAGAKTALSEMARVTKQRGIVAVTTECIVNGAPPYEGPGNTLFAPSQIDQLALEIPGLELVEPVDFLISAATVAKVKLLADAVQEADRGITDYPSLVMEHKGREYTSVSLFFRRSDG